MFRKKTERVLLFQGRSIHLIDPVEGLISYQFNQLEVFFRENKNTLCLFASPLVVSYIHETIHLKKKELLAADQQILSLSRAPLKNRTVESIQLSEKKALTIHSHLTERGEDLLVRIKRVKKAVQWQAAIPFFIHNLLQYPQQNIREKPIFRCFLEEEVFEIVWRSAIPFIQLVQSWRPAEKVDNNEEYFRKLLKVSSEQRTSSDISLFDRELDSAGVALLNNLVFPDGDPLKHRSIKRSGASDGKFSHYLKIKYLIVFIYSLAAIWLVTTKIRHMNLVEEKNSLYEKMAIQKNRSSVQTKMERFEKKYFQESVLSELILSERFRLDRKIQEVEEKIEGTSFWLSEFRGDNLSTTLSLVMSGSSGNSNIEPLRKSFESLGEARILGSSRSIKKGLQIVEYQIQIVFSDRVVRND